MITRLLIFGVYVLAFIPAGYGFIAVFLPECRCLLRLIMSWLLAMALLTLSIFVCLLCGAQFGVALVVLNWLGLTCMSFIVLGVGTHLKKRGGSPSTGPSRQNVPARPFATRLFNNGIVVFLALSVWLTCLHASFSRGIQDYPQFAIYGLKARAMVSDKGIPLRVLQEPGFFYTQPGYPWAVPMLLAGGYAFGGSDTHGSIVLAKTIAPFFGVLFFLVLYAWFVQIRPDRQLAAAWGAFVMSSGAIPLFAASELYPDLLLATFSSTGMILLYVYINRDKRSALLFGLLFLGAAAWIKNEGIAVLTIALVLLLPTVWRRRHGFTLGWAIIAPLFFMLPWQLYRHHLGLSNPDFAFLQIPPTGDVLAAAKTVGNAFLRGVFRELLLFNGIWGISLLMILLHPRSFFKNPGNRLLFFFTLIITAVYLTVYFFSTMDLDTHLRALNRTMMLPGTILFWAALNTVFDRPNGPPPRTAGIHDEECPQLSNKKLCHNTQKLENHKK